MSRRKPKGFYKKKDKKGKMVTHPIFDRKGRRYVEPSMKVYKVEAPLKVGEPDVIRNSTWCKVEERGKTVIKQIKDCLPPRQWIKKMHKEVPPNARDPVAVISNIWWNLSAKKKLEIMKKYGKWKQTYKSNPFGVMGRRQIRAGEGERDILPSVAHELDTGWLPYLEKGIYEGMDADERAEVALLVREARSADPAKRAVASTELEIRYPDAYQHAKTGITGVVDVPKHFEDRPKAVPRREVAVPPVSITVAPKEVAPPKEKPHLATRIARFREERLRKSLERKKARAELRKMDAEETKMRTEIRRLRAEAEAVEVKSPIEARTLKAEARRKEQEAKLLKTKVDEKREEIRILEKDAKALAESMGKEAEEWAKTKRVKRWEKRSKRKKKGFPPETYIS